MTAVRILSAFLCLGLVACAGAAPDDVLGPVTSKSAQTGSGSKKAAATSGAASPGDVAGAPDGTDLGNQRQDGDSQGQPDGQPALPGLPGAPSGPIHPDIPPPPGGPTVSCVIAPEASSPDQATTFSSCVTGTLEGNSFVRIVAPEDARSMVISHEESSQILYRVGAETDQLGLPVQLTFDTTFTDGDQQLRVSPGAAYLFRLTAMNGGGNDDPATFQINVQFTARH